MEFRTIGMMIQIIRLQQIVLNQTNGQLGYGLNKLQYSFLIA